jgi:predicted aspartyl protease
LRTPFDPKDGLIVVTARLSGPSGPIFTQLALDTGATTTLINPSSLLAIGCDPATVSERTRITTGSGVEFAARLTIPSLDVLGESRANFIVLSHTLPPSASVDGLLGLDFFRGRELNINFANGIIDLK